MTLTFDLKFAPQLLVQDHVSTKFEVYTALRFPVSRRYRTKDRQTDKRT